MPPLFEKASGLTESIIGAAIEVHRDKKPGLIEAIYEWCLMKELKLRGLNCVSQQTVLIESQGFTREERLRVDLLVGTLRIGGSEERGEGHPDPQNATLELHEVAEGTAWAAHQFPRAESQRRHRPVDPARSRPVKPRLQQEAAELAESSFFVSSAIACSIGDRRPEASARRNLGRL